MVLCAHRLRPGEGGAVHHAHARNVQTVEDLVQQRRVAARFGDVEGVQNAVLEDIHFVDVGALRQLASLAAHIAHVEHYTPLPICRPSEAFQFWI